MAQSPIAASHTWRGELGSCHVYNGRAIEECHINQALSYMAAADPATAPRGRKTLFASAGYLGSSHGRPVPPAVGPGVEFVCTLHRWDRGRHWTVCWLDIAKQHILVFDTLAEPEPAAFFLPPKHHQAQRRSSAIAALSDWLVGTRALSAPLEETPLSDLVRISPVGCEENVAGDATAAIRCLNFVRAMLCGKGACDDPTTAAGVCWGALSEQQLAWWAEMFEEFEHWDGSGRGECQLDYWRGGWLADGIWQAGEYQQEDYGVV